MVLIVTYDLHNPGRDYDKIATTLKTAASWAHPQGSVWFIDTSLTPSEWIVKLRAAGDPSDEFFIAKLAHNWHSINTDNDVVSWLKNTSRNW